MKRVIIAAISSGSGKTIITCGLIKALTDKKLKVSAYKCGPDYIDPMFHRNILGVPSENLDSFFCDEIMLNRLLDRSKNSDISIIEGVMGIYDGLGGTSLEGSAYDLAVKTATPIVLVVNARGMGQTLVSLIKGILADDEKRMIKGIILNNMSKGYYEIISKMIESQTGIKVLGYMPKLSGINIDSRHLGLKLPDEIDDLDRQVATVAEAISNCVDIERLLKIAETTTDIHGDYIHRDYIRVGIDNKCEISQGDDHRGMRRPILAVARDEVFCFIYEDNLRLLKELGVELKYFSPLHDSKLPKGCSGILLPGGYPELKLKELEGNASMRESIKKAIDGGMPCIAECGGFMYLHKAIKGEDGREYEMIGAIDGICYNTGKLCRFGYVKVSVNSIENNTEDIVDKSNSISTETDELTIKGHEFHYYDSTANGTDCVAYKPTNTYKAWRFGYASDNKLWGYPHLYYRSCPMLIDKYVEAMRQYAFSVSG